MRKLFLISSLLLSAALAHALPSRGCGTRTKRGYVIDNGASRDFLSVVSYEQALQIFNELKKPQYKIPYLVPETNCHLRAHRISSILAQQGLHTIKALIEVKNEETYGAGMPSFLRDEYVDGEGRVSLTGQDILGRYWNWDYHTAPAICVRHNNRDQLFILDLSVAQTPLPLQSWVRKVTLGLDSTQYKVYSKNMYTLSIGQGNTNTQTSFQRSDMEQVEIGLRADWKKQRRLAK